MKLEQLIYPIADAMQVVLKYDASTGRITGVKTVNLDTPVGVTIQMRCEVIASFVNATKQQAGALFHIKGDLYLLMAYNYEHKALSTYVVSAKATGFKRVELVGCFRLSGVKTIRAAVELLESGVKRVFTCTPPTYNWNKINLPKLVN